MLTLIEPAYRSELALTAAYDRLQPLSIDETVLAGAGGDSAVVTVRSMSAGAKSLPEDDDARGWTADDRATDECRTAQVTGADAGAGVAML